jgi:hypothetical protein
MLLPDSNLPSSSLPWAREIEKRIDGISNSISTNEINNAARDATNETNINNLSALMADQIELRTYAIQPIDYDTAQITGSPGLPTPVYFDTPELAIPITLNKDRNFLINFSSRYIVDTIFPTAGSPYGWEIACEFYLDGDLIGGQQAGRSVYASTLYENDIGPLTATVLVPATAGAHTVSMKISYSTYSASGLTTIGLDGNNLVVTVVQ